MIKKILFIMLMSTSAWADPRFWVKTKATPVMHEDPEMVKERNRRFPPKPTVTPTQKPTPQAAQ